MPTDKEPLTLTLTEWELSDLRDLLELLKERRAVPQTLTLNKLSLRLVRFGAERLRQHAAEGQIALAAAMLGISTSAPPSEQAEQGTAFMSRPKAPAATNPAEVTKITPEAPAKRRPGRPPTGVQKATVSVSLDIDLLGWLAEIGGKESVSPTINRILRGAKDRGES